MHCSGQCWITSPAAQAPDTSLSDSFESRSTGRTRSVSRNSTSWYYQFVPGPFEQWKKSKGAIKCHPWIRKGGYRWLRMIPNLSMKIPELRCSTNPSLAKCTLHNCAKANHNDAFGHCSCAHHHGATGTASDEMMLLGHAHSTAWN